MQSPIGPVMRADMRHEQEINLCYSEALKFRAHVLLQHTHAYPDGCTVATVVIVPSLDSTCF